MTPIAHKPIAPLKNPPAIKRGTRHREGDSGEVKSNFSPTQKQWVPGEYKLTPSGTGPKPPSNLSPAHTPQPLDSSNLHLQDEQNAETQKYNTLSKSSSKRHSDDKNSISNVR